MFNLIKMNLIFNESKKNPKEITITHLKLYYYEEMHMHTEKHPYFLHPLAQCNAGIFFNDHYCHCPPVLQLVHELFKSATLPSTCSPVAHLHSVQHRHI